MKNQILKPVEIAFMLALALVSLSISAAQPDKLAKGFVYKIGDHGPGGGYIFFVDYFDQYPGFTYLEAAPTDATDPSINIAWCDDTTTLIGLNQWNANAVGRGRTNTDAMLSRCSSGAARAADNYTTTSTHAGDWFLPSEGELMLMYTNLRQAGVGSFTTNTYWSSTEVDSNSAWTQSLFPGFQYVNVKSYALGVHAARAF